MRRIVLFVGLRPRDRAVVGASARTARPNDLRGPEGSAGERRARSRDRASGREHAVIAALPPGPRAAAQSRRRPFARCHRERTEPPRRRRRGRAPLRRLAGRRRHGHHQSSDACGQGVGRSGRPAWTPVAAVGHGQGHRRRRHRLGHRRAQRAHRSRARARESRLARTGCHGRSVRPRHAYRGFDWRQRRGRRAGDAGVRGRQRAGRALRGRPRPRQQWIRVHERRHRRHRLDDRQRQALRHPRRQSVPRTPGQRTVRHRSVVPRGGSCLASGAGRRGLGGQLRTDGDGHADSRRRHVAGQLALRHHRRRARHQGHHRSLG